MSQDTPYRSPEYNPHALQRDWGFVVSSARPDVFDILPQSLTSIRAALCRAVIPHAAPDDFAAPVHRPGHPARVTTDHSMGNGAQLYDEVGFDIMALALLADVPAHRPLHLSQNSLIGHWRWLRDVWRFASARPRFTETTHNSPNAVTAALQNGKNNLAIARLRDLFKKVRQMPDDPAIYISFLHSLSVFCPFIATELLWRQGRIDSPPPGRSGTTGNKDNTKR